MKSEIQQVKSFNFTKTSCNSGFENVIIQLRVVRYYKKCLYGLYSFADAARTPHGDNKRPDADRRPAFFMRRHFIAVYGSGYHLPGVRRRRECPAGFTESRRLR